MVVRPFPLMKLGYCNTDAIKKCSPALQEFLGDDQPPVWHVGECEIMLVPPVFLLVLLVN